MSNFEAILLGLVQGLTEFLPVSSSGHLVIGQKLLGFENHDLSFDIVAHLGTLLAVLVVYRRQIFEIIRLLVHSFRVKRWNNGSRITAWVIIATLPTAIIGLSFKDNFEALFNEPKSVAIALFCTAIILFCTKFVSPSRGTDLKHLSVGTLQLDRMSWWKAVFIGVAQSGAIAPGVSRSGSTIAGSLYLGLPADFAALFSFLLAIPAILGASILQFKDVAVGDLFQTYLVMGFISSFFFGYIGLRLVINFVKKGRIDIFSSYLVVVAAWLYFF
ncbi:MAG: undecaprenyl-diphosphate phosphatase [Bdellovibrionales bacterium]